MGSRRHHGKMGALALRQLMQGALDLMQVGATQSLKWWLPLEIWQHTLSVLAEHVSAASPAACPGTNLQATVSSVCNFPCAVYPDLQLQTSPHMASKAVLSHQLHRAAFGQTACALPTDLQIDLCDVDVLPDLIGQDAQEQLAVRIPLVLPHAVQ